MVYFVGEHSHTHTGSHLANEAKTGNKSKREYSLQKVSRHDTIDCCADSTFEDRARRGSETQISRSNVSGAYAHWRHTWDKTRGNFIILGLGNVDCTGRLSEGWYRYKTNTKYCRYCGIPRVGGSDKLIRFLTTKWKKKRKKTFTFSKASWLMITGFAQDYVMSENCFCL